MSSTQLPFAPPASKLLTKTATIAFIGITYFFIVDVALYFLNPGYELVLASAGDYDIGPYGLLVTSAFLGLGLGSLTLAIGLYQGIARPGRSWIGLLLLGIWGIGMLVAAIFPASNAGSTVPHMTTVRLAGIFPVEVEAYPETRFGWIHLLAMLWSFFSLTLATIFLTWRFKLDENWRPFHRLALTLAFLMLAASLWFLLELRFPTFRSFAVFAPGVFVVAGGLITGLLWLLLTAVHLRFMVARSVSK